MTKSFLENWERSETVAKGLFSDSNSSYNRKNFKQTSRDRLLHDMLHSIKKGGSKSTWKVLIVDEFTLKIVSHFFKMSDIAGESISLVEHLNKKRQSLSCMDAIYFIQPTHENVVTFLSDMSGRSPLYKEAFLFFCSHISQKLVTCIKSDPTVSLRLRAFREMNLEYFAVDNQCFITNNERALDELFLDEEDTRQGYSHLNAMATRIATVFFSLREFPLVRYRAAKSLDATKMTTFADLIPTKLAAGVWDCLLNYKKKHPDFFPETETCNLLILDRSVDQIAPIIHEWTYEAMCYDLLSMEGNKYVYEVPSKTGGPPEKKEARLDDHDPIWLELRHAHIADATERLHEKMTHFALNNIVSQIQNGKRGVREPSTRDLQKMVQALPQYSELIDKLSLHVGILGEINRIISELGLRELGQLEQDLTFGDVGVEDVIRYLSTNQAMSHENILRLMMILAVIYPEKFEGEQGDYFMKLAKLQLHDMNAVKNLRLLGGASYTKISPISRLALKFGIQQETRAIRKERKGEDEMWQLSRFYPIMEELIEKLSKGELSNEDYPCLNDPRPSKRPVAHSVRTRSTPMWARPHSCDSDFKKMGQRIFVFIVGGATRSELRVCHKLTTKLEREIVLGSSSLDNPLEFIKKLKLIDAKLPISKVDDSLGNAGKSRQI